MSDPVLDVDEPDAAPRAVALVLHGGRAKGMGAVRARQMAVVRMQPFAAGLRRAGRAHGLAVARLRYRVRGWNGSAASPVADVCWALDQLAERLPGVPVALVGHSMGGRAAVYAAGHQSVQAVVGLAPWIEAGDPYQQCAGRQLFFVHGALDRMTSPRQSAAYAQRAASVARSVAYVSLGRERHAMLRRARWWHELTTGYVLAVMCDRPPGETVSAGYANVLMRSLAGEGPLVV